MKEPRVKSEYIEKIMVYHKTIQKIKMQAPFEIRMNMFLVQCHELNNKLIHECEKLIDLILKNIFDKNNDLALEISN